MVGRYCWSTACEQWGLNGLLPGSFVKRFWPIGQDQREEGAGRHGALVEEEDSDGGQAVALVTARGQVADATARGRWRDCDRVLAPKQSASVGPASMA